MPRRRTHVAKTAAKKETKTVSEPKTNTTGSTEPEKGLVEPANENEDVLGDLKGLVTKNQARKSLGLDEYEQPFAPRREPGVTEDAYLNLDSVDSRLDPENGKKISGSSDTGAEDVTGDSDTVVAGMETPASEKKSDRSESADHREQVVRKIHDAIGAAKRGNVGATSIKIDKDFDEATAALWVSYLEEEGVQVEFKDKKGADYRIMAISW